MGKKERKVLQFVSVALPAMGLVLMVCFLATGSGLGAGLSFVVAAALSAPIRIFLELVSELESTETMNDSLKGRDSAL